MDQVKIGHYIAELRQKEGLTQEDFGKQLRVTARTIARWEAGFSLPDIERLAAMSPILHVSVNELVNGASIPTQEFSKISDENLVKCITENAFSVDEKKEDLKWEWRRDHLLLLIGLGLVFLLFFILPFIVNRPELASFSFLLLLIEYAWQNNKMMIYIENRLYGKPIAETKTKKKA